MDKILEYQIIEAVSTSQYTEIYRAKDASHQNVILKLLSDEQVDAEKLARFKKEYEITTQLASEWIVRPYDLLKYKDTYVMVLEDFGGISLNRFIAKNSPCINQNQLIDLLRVAILITKALHDVHNQQFIHKDINPTNIIYNKDKGLLKIIDFGLATKLKNELFEPTDESRFEGTYAYISPEQTGRFNRNIDYRTDFYSLGITLYELFSGRLPFNAESPREWIHCHIAKEPLRLHQLNANVPEELSEIVMKLINKTAEKRYQSGFGIISDLEKCVDNLTSNGYITDFELGKNDVPQKFQLPQKLYGREREINELLSFYNSLQKDESALILINGYSGIGKTSIIQEIQRPVVESQGYFASGKFDPLKKNIPYNAFLQALTKLIKSILSEGEEEIQNWKQRLTYNLNGNARLITDAIPELTLIIGEQPELPVLPAAESQNRFFNTFKNLINTFTAHEHPLVLFLDDLHWADSASLDMIENLLMNHQNGAFLLIGAYRDNEVGPDHPLLNSINAITKANIKCENIHIQPLDEEAVQNLLTDIFSLDTELVRSLVRLIMTKTDGNPFYIIEFLKNLYQHQLLYFDSTTGKWIVALDEIKKSDVAENVAVFISKNIQKLPEESQYILKYAACIGSTFDAGLICEATKKPWEDIIYGLNISAEESLIYPLSGQYRFAEYDSEISVAYKFVHDRIQQEIYSQISEGERNSIHREIGQILLKKRIISNKDDLLYTILEHLNTGNENLQPEENMHLAKLNLQACRQSKKAGAFGHALFYADICIRFMDPSAWQTHYDLSFQIHKEYAEALFLIGKYSEMEHALNESVKLVNQVVEKAQLLEIRVQSYIAQHRQPEAVNEALAILKLLGVRFPKNPKTHHILLNFLKVSMRLKKIKSTGDIQLPAMTEPKMLAAMNLMATILSASYYVNPNLFPLIAFKLIQLTLTYGIAPKSPVAFITLGLIEWSLNRIDQGYLHGSLGMKMFEKLDAREHWAQAACIYHTGVVWNEPLDNAINGLFEAYKVGIDTGDNEFAVASASAGLTYKFYSGKDIHDLYVEAQKYRNALAHLNQNVPFNQIKVMLQTFRHFIDDTNEPEILNGAFYNESEMQSHFLEVKDNASAIDLYIKKMVLAYHFKRYRQARIITNQARNIVKDVSALFLYAEFHFYESLILLANINDYDKKETRWAWKRIKRSLKKFKKWTKYCQPNFENKYYLLQAEIEKHTGNKLLASDLYDKAIERAQKEGNLLEQALSNERAGLFWFMHNKTEFAQLYLSKAYKIYGIWGGNAKANAIKNEFKELIIHVENPGTGLVNKTVSESSSGTSKSIQTFDLEVIIEASKTLSSEIVFSELIKKTLTIILEHAGAQKGLLLIKDGNKALSVEAIGYVEKNEIKVALDSKEITGELLPHSVIRYTERTRETVILHNASKSGDFMQDKYIGKHQVKSAIAIPILHQSMFSGILYLENNLSTQVFNPKRVDILTILCTQAAISIENAKLYNSLEQKVEERTQEISEKNTLLQNAYDQLKELNATKDKFFSILAHDLRGPIGNINQFFDIITNEDIDFDSEEFESYIADFKKTSKNTYALLNNLLMWAQSQRNELIFEPRVSSLNKRVETNLSLIEQKAQTKGVSLINHLSFETTAYFDVNLIDTVIRNLVNNALKYTSKGGSIAVSVETNENFAIVSVKDSGIGMSENIKNNLFNIQNKTKSKKGTDGEVGTGLGLILCKEFVEKNGGEIWVESKENEGSTFHFSVPLHKD